MISALANLADGMRRAGVPVSTGEILDATLALESIDLIDRKAVRSALMISLIKNKEHLAIFELFFESAFRSNFGETDEVDIALQFQQGLAGDESALSAAIRAAVMEHGGLQDGRYLGTEYHANRVLRRLHMSGALSFGKENANVSELTDLARIQSGIANEVRKYASGDELDAEASRLAGDKIQFLRLSNDELHRLRVRTRLLGRKLAVRLRVKHTRGRKGRLNARLTTRKSLASGGVPLDAVFHRPSPHRPDVVVLADVSGSVSGFARFTLQLIHALSGELGNVRTFVFVDEVDEVTSYFRKGRDFRWVIEQVDMRAKTLGDVGHSDYGNVFSLFADRYLRILRPTTTLLILGDARNNYHTVNAEALQQISSKVRHVYWLNPEPQGHWNTADSVLDNYAKHCDAVFECRDLDQLVKVIERL